MFIFPDKMHTQYSNNNSNNQSINDIVMKSVSKRIKIEPQMIDDDNIYDLNVEANEQYRHHSGHQHRQLHSHQQYSSQPSRQHINHHRHHQHQQLNDQQAILFQRGLHHALHGQPHHLPLTHPSHLSFNNNNNNGNNNDLIVTHQLLNLVCISTL